MSADADIVSLDVPKDVVWIAQKLESAGFSTWAVGGGVRDALRGENPQDWDLATAARPGDVRRIFRRTVPIGIEYGTVGVIARDGHMYEVTTFRRDVETFGRRARVKFSDRLEEDLERRDFTINAIAWHPVTGEVRDPHGGREDLETGILRTVGDPEQRFAEDRLRTLRALRFAGQFDMRIEEATWRGITGSVGHLRPLSAERVREELMKVLQGQDRPSRSLRLYGESGILGELYPELEACRSDSTEAGGGNHWIGALEACDDIPRRYPVIRLAALLMWTGWCHPDAADVGEKELAARSAAVAGALLRRLKFSNADQDRVVHLIAQTGTRPDSTASDGDVRRWVAVVGREHLNDIFRLLIAALRAQPETRGSVTDLVRLRTRATAAARSGAPLSIGELAISGRDLRSLGISPGPRYGEILRSMLDRVLDEPELNERNRLMGLVAEEIVGSEEGR